MFDIEKWYKHTNTHIVNLDAWPWVSLRRKRRRRGRRKRWIPPRRSNQGTINIKRGRGGRAI